MISLVFYSMKSLFIANIAGSNPYRVTLDETIGQYKNILLNYFQISQVPVTANVPNALYANLVFDVDSVSQKEIIKINTNGYSPGTPIPLEGAFTCRNYPNPLYIGRFSASPYAKELSIRILDPNGNLLSFGSCNLWFTLTE